MLYPIPTETLMLYHGFLHEGLPRIQFVAELRDVLELAREVLRQRHLGIGNRTRLEYIHHSSGMRGLPWPEFLSTRARRVRWY